MIIRKADINDVEELVDLRFAYLNCHFGGLEKKQRVQLEKQLPEFFRNHIGRDFIAYIAKEGDRAVATAYMLIIEKPGNPNFITGRTGLLLNVYTHPDYRRQGIATKLLNFLIQDAREENLSFIELSATEEGEPVYRKMGFTEKVSDCMEMILRL